MLLDIHMSMCNIVQTCIHCTHKLLQSPIKVVLGTSRKAKRFGTKRRLVEQEETFVYIPILQTLQKLLNNDTVLTEVVCVCMYNDYKCTCT